MGSSQWPSGPVGWRAAGLPADLGAPVGVQVLAEHDVVGNGQPVDAGPVERLGLANDVTPTSRILGSERAQHH